METCSDWEMRLLKNKLDRILIIVSLSMILANGVDAILRIRPDCSYTYLARDVICVILGGGLLRLLAVFAVWLNELADGDDDFYL